MAQPTYDRNQRRLNGQHERQRAIWIDKLGIHRKQRAPDGSNNLYPLGPKYPLLPSQRLSPYR